MAYRLKLDEPLDKGFMRVGSEQIERAAKCLSGNDDPHRGVHDARKCLKRLRSLLALFRDALDEAPRRQIDHAFRDIGRALASTRDVQAMLDALADLASFDHAADDLPALRAMATRLDKSRADQPAAKHFEAPLAALHRVREEFASLTLRDASLTAVENGLVRTYGHARHWRERAQNENCDESFHEWRKRVQRHWRHMQLLEPAWPGVMRARIESARDLAEMIGKDHDLAMLVGHLEPAPRRYGGVVRVRAAAAVCRRRQAQLRALMLPAGERLFVERPRAFGRNIAHYWTLACAQRSIEQADYVKIVEAA